MGRESSASLRRNTITASQLIHKDLIKAAFFFAFYIGQDDLFSLLPLGHSSNERHVPLYIGRDLSMDPVPRLLAQRLNIPFETSSPRPLPTEQFELLAQASQQGYSEIYGPNFRAVYPEKKRQGAAHSKLGVIVYDGWLRVFITSANLMALDMEDVDNVSRDNFPSH